MHLPFATPVPATSHFRQLLALTAALVFWIGVPAGSAAITSVPLIGEWHFAMDPIERGEELGWPQPDAGWAGKKPHPAAGWDSVQIPHDFLSDPRYAFTGTGWYRRSFAAPADAGDHRVWRLRFEQVSQRCRVWLNGRFVGAHEGGYTPFEFVVTPHVKPGSQNFLVVAVDNRIRVRALPGARTGKSPTEQLFPWLNYGGILGDVTLSAHAPVHVLRQQIEAIPDASGATAVRIGVVVRNESTTEQRADVDVVVAGHLNLRANATLAAQSQQVITLEGRLPAASVKPWGLEEQPLHVSRVRVRSSGGEDSIEDVFGIRSIAAQDGKLLLNGKQVRLAGANRARGHGKFGGLDPDEAVVQDMELMKAAGLRLARLQHTPPRRNLLDWADRNGMLIILEVGVWGTRDVDLPSSELRDQFKREMREMIAMAANHPSVIGWSVGNEYESWTKEGLEWTRDMAAFVRSLDGTRLVTFAALGGALRHLRDDGDASREHAFDHVDLICVNLYFPPAEVAGFLDPVHVRWPAKPVMISEFGLRADRKPEPERVAHFDEMLALARARPWVCGLSYWSFNDYASHYPGSGADGYRRWGLVDEFRRPRPLYDHVRQRVGAGLDN